MAIKVFMVHVGDVVENPKPSEYGVYLQRKELISNELKTFEKYHIINADSQMESLVEAGVEMDYGHFSDRKSIKALWKAGLAICKRSKEVDLIHVLWGTTTALITVLFSSKPVVISFCGSDLLGQVDEHGNISLSGKISRFLSQISALMARSIITKSEHMKRSLWSLSKGKATAIPNGVNLASFQELNQAEAKAKLNWSGPEQNLLFFSGGGAPVKNQALAQEVFDLLKSDFPKLNLKIVHGVPHSELIYYYNAADVLLLTSFHEGSNNSLKEAMACNLPIVSVDVGDSRERISDIDNCRLLSNYNAQEMASAVASILESGKRSNGRDFINFVSMEYIAKRVIDVYKSAIK